MSSGQYPTDVQFAGLIQAATAAADAQHQNGSVLGKRRRHDDDSMIDTQLRDSSTENQGPAGQLPQQSPLLQSSASVLFREPSEKSKKYSRPPLGKVYADLELAPEHFLRLQNAAKSYMLDEDHLERRNVVGHKKHSSNNDVAKLRLWNCVEDFLVEDNNGEKWFGHNHGMGHQRTFFWPEDKQRIVKLCMPLFRKMVTNERQRIYASETRKQDPGKNDKDKKAAAVVVSPGNGSPRPESIGKDDQMDDQTFETPAPAEQIHTTDTPVQVQRHTGTTEDLTLHVNVVASANDAGHRVVPKFSVSAEDLTTLTKLIAEAKKHYPDLQLDTTINEEMDMFTPTVRVWLPDGLIRVKTDGEWMVALLSAGMVDWMDSEVRVLIET